MRLVVARLLSIAGHPALVVPLASMALTSSHGASARELGYVAACAWGVAVAVMAFSWGQVRRGRWAHVDASVRGERRSLNRVLLLLFVAAAIVAAFLLGDRRPAMVFALSAGIVAFAMLLAGRLKTSLHVAFAAFAAALGWPAAAWVACGLAGTAAIAWSRLALGRHTRAEVIVGAVVGAMAGLAWLAVP